MRVRQLIIVLLLVANVAYADVTAEIISYKIDDNGNIEVHTQYKIEGAEVQTRYPQENGKYYGVTRYVASSFGNMNNPQIKSRILTEIEDQVNALGIESFMKKENKEITDNKLGGLVGSTILQEQFNLGVDNDGDHKVDQIWTVKSDGSKIDETDVPPISP